jgi:hypothetical protein
VPLETPKLDDRTYRELLEETLSRIPVHTPEWTNFTQSDPGVTLVQLFAFLTENLLYRCNGIPERNRMKFLSLLGQTLQPAAAARGLVTVANDRRSGPEAVLLEAGATLRAGEIPFVTERGLQVLPVEGKVYFKRKVTGLSPTIKFQIQKLYCALIETYPTLAAEPAVYETCLLPPDGVRLADSIDGALWIALLLRDCDARSEGRPLDRVMTAVRQELAGKVLSLGFVPALQADVPTLAPARFESSESANELVFQLPKPEVDWKLPVSDRRARYVTCRTAGVDDVLRAPGIVELVLPERDAIGTWANLDPTEDGLGDFPPALIDSKVAERVITWVRLVPRNPAAASFLWLGMNATLVTQRERVNERLALATGEPDQEISLQRPPVLRDTVTVTVAGRAWSRVDDLMDAGHEVPVTDARLQPGAPSPAPREARVFTLDAEAGRVRFGDGFHGARPPRGARIDVAYDHCRGRIGNVGAGAITSVGAGVPASLKPTNPVRTWGGADAETAADGEARISAVLAHRNRAVTAEDFVEITRATPGVCVGRVEVLPAFRPELAPNEPGCAPGVVTIMVVPAHDTLRPDAPSPDPFFCGAVCRWLDRHRLVTTEVLVRGPSYMPILVSAGIVVKSGMSAAEVRERVKTRLLRALAPLRSAGDSDDPAPREGWPLRKAVIAHELLAEASRVEGVLYVTRIEIGAAVVGASQPPTAVETIPMSGLELPRVAAISVSIGDPVPLAQLAWGGSTGAGPDGQAGEAGYGSVPIVPIPTTPEGC